MDQRLAALLEEIREPKYLKRLTVKTRGKTVLIAVDDIDYIEAEGNYVSLRTKDEKHLVRSALHQLEGKLDPDKFIRVHRSTIINLDSVREMYPLFNGDQAIIMKNGRELVLTRNYREQLKNLLGGL